MPAENSTAAYAPRYGLMDTGADYVPGVPCCVCGRFVGRDGLIHVETFEMSNEIASLDGTCRRCLDADD